MDRAGVRGGRYILLPTYYVGGTHPSKSVRVMPLNQSVPVLDTANVLLPGMKLAPHTAFPRGRIVQRAKDDVACPHSALCPLIVPPGACMPRKSDRGITAGRLLRNTL